MRYEYSLYLESQCPYRSQRNITWQVRVSNIYLKSIIFAEAL